ncbi:MAG: ABC transporter ATP-binding protein [Verrucomicrobia bacterium]|jgi:putative ABC transport system ATP-binding protein|nr:ABC transporter ATP-binding protein [Verrucomicrobiota bacterium]MDA7510091.1 ABC transporter ATP-binding protein [Verrucomicrobiota bacterium]MDA7667666.1 ABC transporter ATP-binding protein [bacterium]MDB4746328.1 ABC transporter ATP-binding protein [Verrucomicrobiota bacterium]
MDSTPVLRVKALNKVYRSSDRDLAVLSDISFSVAAGETCAILGPSGSGKTTLLGLCAGLDHATSGEVWLQNQSLNQLDEDGRAAHRNQHIGFVFQNFQLMTSLTSLENVMVPLELRGGRSVQDKATELLERVGLKDRQHHYPNQLSGGEQQRVALARAFINEPKILFADEPTGNLDGSTSTKVIDLIFALNRDLGTALVLVTHNADLGAKTGRIIRLKDGALESDIRSSTEG